MAATQKLYPRGTVKRIVKAHSNRSVSKNADILVRYKSPGLALASRDNGLADMSVFSKTDLFGLHAVHARVR